MKIYYNPSTGEWYYDNLPMTRRIDEETIFSGFPSVEQLTEWGFEEYIPPTPDPLEEAKNKKIQELVAYDSSPNVNSFTLAGKSLWIVPADRTNYMITLEGARRLGIESISFLGETIPVDTAITILDAINVYAMQCVGVTDTHKANINALTTVEEVEAYDFTTGYPEKLNFDLLLAINEN